MLGLSPFKVKISLAIISEVTNYQSSEIELHPVKSVSDRDWRSTHPGRHVGDLSSSPRKSRHPCSNLKLEDGRPLFNLARADRVTGLIVILVSNVHNSSYPNN